MRRKRWADKVGGLKGGRLSGRASARRGIVNWKRLIAPADTGLAPAKFRFQTVRVAGEDTTSRRLDQDSEVLLKR